MLEKSGTTDAAAAGYTKEEIDESIRVEEENGGSFLTNYLKPWINIAALKVFEWAAATVKDIEPREVQIL
jgi:hypothetical protein